MTLKKKINYEKQQYLGILKVFWEYEEREREWHATAYNVHIGKMAALPPLENMCAIASLSPAGKCSVAATSPICWTLCAMQESVSG